MDQLSQQVPVNAKNKTSLKRNLNSKKPKTRSRGIANGPASFKGGLNVFSISPNERKHKGRALNSANKTNHETTLKKDSCEGMFAAKAPSSIFKISPECEAFINKLRMENSETTLTQRRRKDRKSKNVKRTKLNGFIAFRSFYSKDIPTKHQAVLSSKLAKEWKKHPDKQLMWQRYAAEFSLFSADRSDIGFTDWLIGATTGNLTEEHMKEGAGDTPIGCRIQNIFNNDEQRYSLDMVDCLIDSDSVKNPFMDFSNL